MTAPCALCARDLLKVTSCERADCMWDFSPVVPMREVVAMPSPEYQRRKNVR